MHFCQAKYYIIIQHPFQFRAIVDTAIKKNPELFPVEIRFGYKMKEIRFSKKLNLKIRKRFNQLQPVITKIKVSYKLIDQLAMQTCVARP